MPYLVCADGQSGWWKESHKLLLNIQLKLLGHEFLARLWQSVCYLDNDCLAVAPLVD